MPQPSLAEFWLGHKLNHILDLRPRLLTDGCKALLRQSIENPRSAARAFSSRAFRSSSDISRLARISSRIFGISSDKTASPAVRLNRLDHKGIAQPFRAERTGALSPLHPACRYPPRRFGGISADRTTSLPSGTRTAWGNRNFRTQQKTTPVVDRLRDLVLVEIFPDSVFERLPLGVISDRQRLLDYVIENLLVSTI